MFKFPLINSFYFQNTPLTIPIIFLISFPLSLSLVTQSPNYSYSSTVAVLEKFGEGDVTVS